VVKILQIYPTHEVKVHQRGAKGTLIKILSNMFSKMS